MPRSLSVWWKRHLGPKDTKVFKSISPESHSRRTVNVEGKVDDKKEAVLIAYNEVARIAASGLLRVIQTDAGLSPTAPMVSRIQTCFFNVTCWTVDKILAFARDIAKDAKHPTQDDLQVVINLKPVVTAIFDFADRMDFDMKEMFDKWDRSKFTPHGWKCMDETAKVASELTYAIARLIKAHIESIAAPTTESVTSLEKLLTAAADAAKESLRGVANTAIFMANSPPPPYKFLKVSGRKHRTPSSKVDGLQSKEVCTSDEDKNLDQAG